MTRMRLRTIAKSIRPLSSARPCFAARVRPDYHINTEGRTPGFARRQRPSRPPQSSSEQPHETQPGNSIAPGKNAQVSSALQQGAENDTNSLLSPINVPEDRYGILQPDHPATSILANSSIIVQRQLEMMNVFLGFEQANKYVLMDARGGHIGYMAEQEHGIGNTLARQMLKTHRSFTMHVFDKNGREMLRFHRPFSWISSRIQVYNAVRPDSPSYTSSTASQGTSPSSITEQTSAQTSSLPLTEMRIIGEVQQQWAPLRRRYNLFLNRDLSPTTTSRVVPRLTSGNITLPPSKALTTTTDAHARAPSFAQFAYVNEPFLSWDFSLLTSADKLVGSVNRNFAGWGREIFTDTGVYALRMDAAGLEPDKSKEMVFQKENAAQITGASSMGMTLDQRAVMLATAVSIDFDYFSRHSSAAGGGLGFMPIWFPFPTGGDAAGAEAGGAIAGAEGVVAAGGADGAGGGAAAGGSGALEEGSAAGGALSGVEGAGRGLGVGEGVMAGVGTMVGYEALQRARDRSQEQGQEVWGEEQQPEQQSEQQVEDNNSRDDWEAPPKAGEGKGDGFDMDDFF